MCHQPASSYVKHVVKNVEVCAKSTSNCVDVCKNGLAKAYEMFRVVDENGDRSLAEEMANNTTETFKTGVIRGTGSRQTGGVRRLVGRSRQRAYCLTTCPPSPPQLRVPYKGKKLTGAALEKQVDKWVSYGTIEPSAGEAIKRVSNNPGWLDLVRHACASCGRRPVVALRLTRPSAVYCLLPASPTSTSCCSVPALRWARS